MSDHDAPLAGPIEPLLRGKSTPFGGWALTLLGVAIVAGSLHGALTGEERVLDALALAVLGAVFGGGLAAAGALLLAEKGGVALGSARDGRRLVLFRGAGVRDALAVPADRLVAARLVPRDEVWGREPTRNWSCELLRDDACPVVLAESADHDAVRAVGRAVEERLGLPLQEHDDWSPPGPAPDDERTDGAAPTEGQRAVRARRRGPLPRVLLVLGLGGVVIGAVLMSQVEKAPIFGFLFGPTLFFLGLALAGASLTGLLATDVVAWTSSEVRRMSRLGPLSWGKKALPRGEACYLRVRPRGLVGTSLELVGRERTLVLVGGISRGSRRGYEGLLALADDLQRSLRLDDEGSSRIA